VSDREQKTEMISTSSWARKTLVLIKPALLAKATKEELSFAKIGRGEQLCIPMTAATTARRLS
jgi:hypothetical protein